MADKKLNEVAKVTDMAYVPVIMSDGSIGQIAKADLATVVAGLLGKPLGSMNRTEDATNFDTITSNGIYLARCGEGLNSPVTTNVRVILVTLSPASTFYVQLAFRFDTSEFFWRAFWPGYGWQPWKLITTNV